MYELSRCGNILAHCNESQQRPRRLRVVACSCGDTLRRRRGAYSDVLSVNESTRVPSHHRCRYNKLLFTAELRVHVLSDRSLALS